MSKSFKSFGPTGMRPRGFYSDPARHHSNPLAVLRILGIAGFKRKLAKDKIVAGPRLDNRMSNQAAVTGSGLGLGFGFRSAGPDPRGSRRPDWQNKVVPLGNFYKS